MTNTKFYDLGQGWIALVEDAADFSDLFYDVANESLKECGIAITANDPRLFDGGDQDVLKWYRKTVEEFEDLKDQIRNYMTLSPLEFNEILEAYTVAYHDLQGYIKIDGLRSYNDHNVYTVVIDVEEYRKATGNTQDEAEITKYARGLAEDYLHAVAGQVARAGVSRKFDLVKEYGNSWKQQITEDPEEYSGWDMLYNDDLLYEVTPQKLADNGLLPFPLNPVAKEMK